ncbi:MAG: 4-(cytidine 5'-diphospho)-2-C-methyl-D-erythritol kinase [Bacteroidaceae bacterium]|nr:4-(cytidine 5'-diphospho)-2-C-methyl-D-erythritol kinase [Bacteroidaceae bacterium]
MTLYPPAKINLGLNIVGKRPDGYHNLETVFYPLHDVTDILEVEIAEDGSSGSNCSSGTVELSLAGNPVDGDPEKNLVVKAYKVLAEQFQLPAMKVNLTKRIPMQAGMGGGSADAAYMLKAVNELAGLNLSDEELEAFALKLGADAPFFIKGKPCFATGVGEIFTPMNFSLEGYEVKFCKPEDISVSTADAFRNIPIKQPERSCMDIVLNEPIENWKQLLQNDFETTVFAKYPKLAEIKQQFYNDGAVYAAMTGSGSAIIAIYHG